MKKRSLKYLENLPSVKDKKIIVTGANTGIGYAACDLLLGKGAHIVLACRNKERGEAALAKLQAAHPKSKVELMHFDQSSLSLIEEAVKEIKEKHNDFYALILNAGIMCPGEDKWYCPGVPLTSGTNFIAPLYILTLLKDFLNNVKDDKRIIIHGSAASWFEKYKSKEKDILSNNTTQLHQYNLSKLGTTQVFMHFQKENTNPKVKFLLAEPGAVSSDIFRTVKAWYKKVVLVTIKALHFTVPEGALPLVTLATKDVNDGDYYKPRDFFYLRGLPIKKKLKERRRNPKMIEDGYEVIEMIKAIK